MAGQFLLVHYVILKDKTAPFLFVRTARCGPWACAQAVLSRLLVRTW